MNIKDIAEIRRDNLFAQLDKYETDEKFLVKVNRGLERFPKYNTDFSASYLSQIKSGDRNIGGATARKLEDALGLPHNTFDTPISSESDLDNEFEKLAQARTPAQRRKAIKEIAGDVSPEDALRYARLFLDRVETGL